MPELKDLLKAVADERRTLTRDEARAALFAILTSEPEEGGDLKSIVWTFFAALVGMSERSSANALQSNL